MHSSNTTKYLTRTPTLEHRYEMGRKKDGKEPFGGELLRRIMSKPHPVVQSGLRPSTSISKDAGGYLVLDVRVLNKVLMDEITDNDIDTIENQAKLDMKFKIRNDDDVDEDEPGGTTISQLWPSEIKTKESQQIEHGFVVREEWEREKSFFPKLWFNSVTLRQGPLKPVYSSWFKRTGGRRSLRQTGGTRGELMVAIGLYGLDQDSRDKTKVVLNRFNSIERTIKQMKNTPVPVEVRVYVKGASSLLPSSEGTAKLNPFLKLSIEGPFSRLPASRQVKTLLNDVSNAKQNTLNPDFYKLFQLQAEMPNRSILRIQMFNQSFLLSSLIGETIIDLSDRWYNKQWKRRMATGLLPYENRT